MKDENNVIETKTEKENKMSDTTKEIETESNAVLSKLSEEQFNKVRDELWFRLNTFDGFYPSLNTELLTKMKKNFNDRQMSEYFRLAITEDEFVCIVKDYGNVSHQLVVDGEINYHSTDLSEHLTFDISAEKIEEIGVDEINKWGGSGYGDLEEVEENLKSNSMIEEDEYSSYLDDVVRAKSYEPEYEVSVSGVSVITGIEFYIPDREELFPEKLVA